MAGNDMRERGGGLDDLQIHFKIWNQYYRTYFEFETIFLYWRNCEYFSRFPLLNRYLLSPGFFVAKNGKILDICVQRQLFS